MRISAVEPRRKSLVEIYVDGQSAGEIDYETAERMHIRAGTELTDEAWTLLCSESEQNRAKDYGLFLLEKRAYTRKQLRDKLRTKYPAEPVEAALDRLESLGLIDDASYAKRYAADLYRLRSFSKDRIVQELQKRGISRDIARETADELLEEAEETPEERIRGLLETKFARAMQDEKGQRRTVATLQRMGYRWEQIRPVFRDYVAELSEDAP